ncbi:MAG: zinc ABC transporter substrate-binding protein [Chloroflexi bacterium]|nr:zinc ABC transporter substrate-binding protein [Chloroflexota bacterium]
MHVLATIIAGLWLLAACGAPAQELGSEASVPLAAVDLAEGERLTAVATTSIVADIVRHVGGERVTVTSLLPIGADPHAFEPTPSDVARVSEADAVFANGAGLEGFLEQLLRNAGGAPVIYVSEGLELRELEASDAHARDEHAHDPHTWTSPANALIFVDNIERALASLDPGHAPDYAVNARAYRTQLEELDRWIAAQVATIPADRRLLVTDHLVFGYYADRYGLEQVGAVIPGYSTGAAPSAKELAELQDTVRALGVKAVFAGATVNQDLARRVAADAGVTLATLYTGALGPAGSGADSYLGYLRANTETIVGALR